MSDRLHELHPLIWGHAMEAFDNQARIASIDTIFKQGCEKANQVFVSLFGDQMLKGNALIFICNQAATPNPTRSGANHLVCPTRSCC